MITKLFKPLSQCIRIRNTLMLKSKFSSQPEPAPQQPQQVNKPKQLTPEEQALRKSQARIKVCRSQLYKLTRAELDYEKLNSPTKQIQTLQQYLKDMNFKIKQLTDYGSVLQFYRSPQTKPKPKKQTEGKESQSQAQPLPEPKLQVKIFTTALKQLETSQTQILDQMFMTPEDYVEDINGKKLPKGMKKAFSSGQPPKGFSNFEFKKMTEKDANWFLKEVEKSLGFKFGRGEEGELEKKKVLSSFKEFTVHIRTAQSPKWLKAQLFVQGWRNIHLYNLSITQNPHPHPQTPLTPNPYPGILAKQLDATLIDQLQFFLQGQQELDAELLSAIYYYNGLYEHQYYKKWLEDLMDLCK